MDAGIPPPPPPMDTGIPPPPPPSLFPPPISTTSTAIPQLHNHRHPPSQSSSSTSSILIILIVFSSAIIISAAVYFLIRHHCLRRRPPPPPSFSPSNDLTGHVPDHVIPVDSHFPHGVDQSFLPVFTFSSLTGKITDGNCSVCLSEFEGEDQLRLLPLCFHAFHAECIDLWFMKSNQNQTCPICRATANPSEVNKIASVHGGGNGNENVNVNGNDSFRIEIGAFESDFPSNRSNPVDSNDYVLDENPIESTHRRGVSDGSSVDKESTAPEPPVAEVDGGGDGDSSSGRRFWLRDYLDRASASISSRTLSFRGSGRLFTGSSRRSEIIDDFEVTHGRVGEEISEFFRWLSGV